MPQADKKNAQTIRNLWHMKIASKVIEANQAVAVVREAIADNGLAGEFTQGELSAMLAVEGALAELVAGAGIWAAANKYRPGHVTDQSQIGTDVK